VADHCFNCQDCGYHVHAEPRVPPRCVVCQWIAGIVDPAERERLRRFMTPLVHQSRGLAS
jgi:hypothetical protein